MEKLRWKVYNLIRDDDENDTASNIFDGTIITLIAVNVIMVIIDTFSGLPSWYESFAYVVEIVSVIIFTIEYLMRVWTSVYIYSDRRPTLARIRYMLSFMAVIDLLAILPFYISFSHSGRSEGAASPPYDPSSADFQGEPLFQRHAYDRDGPALPGKPVGVFFRRDLRPDDHCVRPDV